MQMRLSRIRPGRRHSAAALVVGLLALASCAPAGTPASIHDLPGAWEIRSGFHPGDRSTEGWGRIEMPHRFSREDYAAVSASPGDWLTLRRRLPAELNERFARGDSMALYSGLLGDVSRVYLNDSLVGGHGSRDPYVGALNRPLLSTLPLPAPSGGTTPAPSYLYFILSAPAEYPAGLIGQTPYVGSSEAVFARFYRDEMILMALIILLLGCAALHFQLGLRLTAEAHNIYFALYCLCLAGWVFMRSGARDQVFAGDIMPRLRVDYTLLFLSGPLLIRFLNRLFGRVRLDLLEICFLVFCVGITAACWFAPYPILTGILTVWQVVTPLAIVYGLVIIAREILRRNPDAYRIAGGMIVLLLLAGYDIIATGVNVTTPSLSRFGIPMLLVGTTALLTNRFIRMYRQSRMVTENLESQVALRTSDLEEARSRAEAGSRSKSEFLANMSHEIRTPMTSILGLSELLGESGLPERENAYVTSLRKAARHLLSLIDDILDFSRIESGRLELEHIAFDLNHAVQDVIDMFRAEADSTGVELAGQMDPALPRQIHGDPGRLRQVLVNLVGNAIKFTEKGRIDLSVAAISDPGARAPGRPTNDPNELMIEFTVSDTGIGIEPEQWTAIFEKFSQSDTSITRRYGGSGLGLSISAHLVTMMGGRIRVESIPGTGSTFFFTIAATPASAPPIPTTSPASRSSLSPVSSPAANGESADRPRPGTRILLVEDNPDNRALFQALLGRYELDIQIAENGQIALERFRAEAFDLVFMDIQMPVMDGLNATRAIRAFEESRRSEPGTPTTRPTPIIALSAHALPEEIERSLAAGCDAYLTKPFARAGILDALGRHLPAS